VTPIWDNVWGALDSNSARRDEGMLSMSACGMRGASRVANVHARTAHGSGVMGLQPLSAAGVSLYAEPSHGGRPVATLAASSSATRRLRSLSHRQHESDHEHSQHGRPSVYEAARVMDVHEHSLSEQSGSSVTSEGGADHSL